MIAIIKNLFRGLWASTLMALSLFSVVTSGYVMGVGMFYLYDNQKETGTLLLYICAYLWALTFFLSHNTRVAFKNANKPQEEIAEKRDLGKEIVTVFTWILTLVGVFAFGAGVIDLLFKNYNMAAGKITIGIVTLVMSVAIWLVISNEAERTTARKGFRSILIILGGFLAGILPVGILLTMIFFPKTIGPTWLSTLYICISGGLGFTSLNIASKTKN
jgi:hypothetical protein